MVLPTGCPRSVVLIITDNSRDLLDQESKVPAISAIPRGVGVACFQMSGALQACHAIVLLSHSILVN